MNHEPKGARFVLLELDEMVAAPEGAKLLAPLASPSPLQCGMAQGVVARYRRGSCGRVRRAVLAPLAVSRDRYPCSELRHQLSRLSPIGEQITAAVELECRHAASNVAANGPRKQQRSSCQGDADAYFLSQVNVGQDRQLDHVLGSSEPIQGLGDLMVQRLGDPSMSRRKVGGGLSSAGHDAHPPGST
jgi:hypothetical protein